MRRCAGAGSTQARTVTCMSKPALALHPCRHLYGFLYVFRVISNSDPVPVFMFIFRTCLGKAGARFGLGLGRGFLCLLRLSLAWRPSSLEPVGPVQPRRVRVCLEAFSFLQMEPWLVASNPEQMDLSRPGGCKVWAGSGSKRSRLDGCKVWVRIWLEASP